MSHLWGNLDPRARGKAVNLSFCSSPSSQLLPAEATQGHRTVLKGTGQRHCGDLVPLSHCGRPSQGWISTNRASVYKEDRQGGHHSKKQMTEAKQIRQIQRPGTYPEPGEKRNLRLF